MTTNKTRDDWRDYASPKRYFDGAASRAAELGYRLEPFWLADPNVTTKRMEIILRTRNVQGLLFAPAPEVSLKVGIDCTPYACVGLETYVALPVVHRVIPDQRHAMVESLKQLRLRGYRRVGLVIRRYADERAALNWSSTFQAFHTHLDMGHWIPPLWLEHRDPAAETNRTAFCDWVSANRPDVILTLDPIVQTWLHALKMRVPKDIGVAYLELTERTPGASGIERESERVGAAAIDLLVTMLNHNQRGLPAYDNTLLIKGTWIEGSTLGAIQPC
jgi:LacI family transcriptional regulator